MILNRDYLEKRRFKLNLKDACRVYEVSGENGMQSVKQKSTKCLDVELAAGDAVLLRVQSVKEEASLLEYRLKM